MKILLICLAAACSLAFFIAYIVLCVKMGKIAEKKGYEGKCVKYTLLCVFMNIYGFLYIIAMPKKENTKEELDLYIENFDNNEDVNIDKEFEKQEILSEVFGTVSSLEEDVAEALEEADDDYETRKEEESESEIKVASENISEEKTQTTKKVKERSSAFVMVVITGILLVLAIAVIGIDMLASK